MSQLPVRQVPLDERSLVETAARIATDTARWGLRLAVLPALPLPGALRRAFFDSARLTLEAMSLAPQALLYSLQGLGAELDDIEARNARREDLGRRLRREARRAGAQQDAAGR